MKTIEERAEQANPNDYHGDLYETGLYYGFNDGYEAGAIEQKAIDDEEYRKDMQYVNVKKQELMDRICKAYCAHHCPHLVEYCWQDDMEIPCAGMRAINKAMEE